MTTRDEAWPDGTPAWVDLMVPDRHAAREFYGALFGWDFEEGDPETGYYTTCSVQGRQAAGIGEAPPGGDAPPVWTTYLAASDAEAVSERIGAAGGTVMMAPMQVMGFGTMAVAADPTGAVFGLWQAGDHKGTSIVNEPGTLVWNECLTRDFEAAKTFYATVFGYGHQDMSGDGFTYATLDVDGKTVGGLGGLGQAPPEVPSHWMTYFAVEDTDAAAAKAVELGATVQSEPRDSEFGRIAVIQGPVGEVFSVITAPAEQPSS